MPSLQSKSKKILVSDTKKILRTLNFNFNLEKILQYSRKESSGFGLWFHFFSTSKNKILIKAIFS